MKIPVGKNKAWIAGLHEGLGRLEEKTRLEVMRASGSACASDILALSGRMLGREVASVADLVVGWNALRASKGLTGSWQYDGNTVKGVFSECGCPLVRSGLMALHPVQCYCSQGMMETIFSLAEGNPVEVILRRTLGRGDEACEFEVNLRPQSKH